MEEIDDVDGNSTDPFIAAAIANERELDLSEEQRRQFKQVCHYYIISYFVAPNGIWSLKIYCTDPLVIFFLDKKRDFIRREGKSTIEDHASSQNNPK